LQSKPKLSIGKVVRRLMPLGLAFALEDQAISRNANRLKKIIATAPSVEMNGSRVSKDGTVSYFVGTRQYQAEYDRKKRELKTYGTAVPPEVVEHIAKFFPKAQKENKTLPSTGTRGQDTTLTIHSWREVTPTQLLLASVKAAVRRKRGF